MANPSLEPAKEQAPQSSEKRPLLSRLSERVSDVLYGIRSRRMVVAIGVAVGAVAQDLGQGFDRIDELSERRDSIEARAARIQKIKDAKNSLGDSVASTRKDPTAGYSADEIYRGDDSDELRAKRRNHLMSVLVNSGNPKTPREIV